MKNYIAHWQERVDYLRAHEPDNKGEINRAEKNLYNHLIKEANKGPSLGSVAKGLIQERRMAKQRASL